MAHLGVILGHRDCKLDRLVSSALGVFLFVLMPLTGHLLKRRNLISDLLLGISSPTWYLILVRIHICVMN